MFSQVHHALSCASRPAITHSMTDVLALMSLCEPQTLNAEGQPWALQTPVHSLAADYPNDHKEAQALMKADATIAGHPFTAPGCLRLHMLHILLISR